MKSLAAMILASDFLAAPVLAQNMDKDKMSAAFGPVPPAR